MLTLKDVQSDKTVSVPPEGALLGRDSDADIVVRDSGVSKRHARVYPINGEWWLEDLNSANGTFLGNQRLSKPVPLVSGSTFALSTYAFEVVEAGPDGHAERTLLNLDPSAAIAEAEQAGPSVAPTTADRRDGVTGDSGRRKAPSVAITASDSASQQVPPQQNDDEMGPETPAGQVPKAIGFFLTTVPRLAFNPVGTVTAGITWQRLQPLEKMPLLGFAAPALALLLAVNVLFQLIVSIVLLIGGHGFSAVSTLVTGIIVAVIGAAVGGVIIAFFYHPLFIFIVERLFKGKSTMKSRTNYLGYVLAFAILMAVPNGIALLSTLLAGLVAPSAPRIAALIPILPSLLQLAFLLVGTLLNYRWLQYFKVIKWVPILVLVGGGFSVLGTGFGLLNSLRLAVSGGPHYAAVVIPKGVEIPAPPRPSKATAVPAKTADAPLPSPFSPTPAPTATPASGKEAAPVAASAPAPTPAATATAAHAPPPESPTAPTKPVASSAPAPAPTASAHAAPAPGPAPAPAPTAAAPAPTPAAPAATPAAGDTGASPYRAFAAKREAVEKWIAEDPTVLKRDQTVFQEYRGYRVAASRARREANRAAANDPVLLQRLVDADLFRTEGRAIDDLYQRLHH